MFAKRPKKEFAPGTFIPKPARIVAILQLCLAFTAILFALSYPFMGELFAQKSRGLLYRTVMGDVSQLSKSNGETAKQYRTLLEGNKERFQTLSEEERNEIIHQYNEITEQGNSTFVEKTKRSLHILIRDLPPLELAWIFFALIISLLLLLRIEGAVAASWILPVIAICYAYMNFHYGKVAELPQDMKLFPSEQVITQEYLSEPLSSDIGVQREQLLRGWKTYLIKEWAKQVPASDPLLFEQQYEEGDFRFNLARLHANKNEVITKSWNEKQSGILLFLYIAWNLFFAWTVNRNLLEQGIILKGQ